jgi:predicted RNA-binding Zn ribbon-like protein
MHELHSSAPTDLCLDFANTVGEHASDTPSETLKDYADLVAWGRAHGAIDEEAERGLLAEAAARPEAAQETLEAARELREVIYRVFSAAADGHAPPPRDLALLNGWLESVQPRLALGREEGKFVYTWREAPHALDRVLWPVVRSTAELLTSGQVERVRECAADTCGWLFIDQSRNRSRRWCDMRDCGNRAKARRHYARTRGT